MSGDFDWRLFGVFGMPPDLTVAERVNTKGWECPKCGRVYAPRKDECYSCNVEIPWFPEEDEE